MKTINRVLASLVLILASLAGLTATTVIASATECVPSEAVPAQHYSWTGGPLEDGVVPPAPPEGEWQANTSQEPHDNNPNVTWLDQEGSGLHYTSHGSSGKADWFYFEPGKPAVECPPDELKELTVDATPIDECGTDNDGWSLVYDEELVDVFVSDVTDPISYVRFTVKPELADEYVIVGEDSFHTRFTDEPCVEEPPAECEPPLVGTPPHCEPPATEPERDVDRDVRCQGDDLVVTVTVTRKDGTQTSSRRVVQDAARCTGPEPRNPGSPERSSKAVPTVVDSGL